MLDVGKVLAWPMMNTVMRMLSDAVGQVAKMTGTLSGRRRVTLGADKLLVGMRRPHYAVAFLK